MRKKENPIRKEKGERQKEAINKEKETKKELKKLLEKVKVKKWKGGSNN